MSLPRSLRSRRAPPPSPQRDPRARGVLAHRKPMRRQAPRTGMQSRTVILYAAPAAKGTPSMGYRLGPRRARAPRCAGSQCCERSPASVVTSIGAAHPLDDPAAGAPSRGPRRDQPWPRGRNSVYLARLDPGRPADRRGDTLSGYSAHTLRSRCRRRSEIHSTRERSMVLRARLLPGQVTR